MGYGTCALDMTISFFALNLLVKSDILVLIQCS